MTELAQQETAEDRTAAPDRDVGLAAQSRAIADARDNSRADTMTLQSRQLVRAPSAVSLDASAMPEVCTKTDAIDAAAFWSLLIDSAPPKWVRSSPPPITPQKAEQYYATFNGIYGTSSYPCLHRPAWADAAECIIRDRTRNELPPLPLDKELIAVPVECAVLLEAFRENGGYLFKGTEMTEHSYEKGGEPIVKDGMVTGWILNEEPEVPITGQDLASNTALVRWHTHPRSELMSSEDVKGGVEIAKFISDLQCKTSRRLADFFDVLYCPRTDSFTWLQYRQPFFTRLFSGIMRVVHGSNMSGQGDA